MKNPFPHQLASGMAPLVVLVASAWTAQAAVTAKLQPESLNLGESGRLTVTVQSSGNTEPDIPDIDGLQITPIGSQSFMRSNNGIISINITRMYQVTPEREGTFTIPAISAPGAGSSQPITLTVGKGNGSAQAAPNNGNAGGRTPRPAPKMKDDGDPSADAKDQPAFLRVVLPKKELTVGELVPVEIKAYFRAGMSASLNGPPVLSSDAFSLNKLSDRATKTQENISGVPYTVVTWTSSLSAVKAGDYPLNLDMPVTVRVQQPRARQRGGSRNPLQDLFDDDAFPGGGFDDPIFDQFFGRTTEKQITLHTDGAEVKINEVPVEGRPRDFSGAVGKFAISGSASPVTGSTGDPLTLKLAITGQGNFNRVSTEGLPAGTDWKSYQPSASFAARDTSETSGTKTFTQSIVPLKAGDQDVPPVRFSYYDPDSKKFVTCESAPIPLNIKQGAAAPVTAPAVAASTEPPAPKPGADGLMPDETLPASPTSTLRPLVKTPWFIAANAAMSGALVLGFAVSRIRARLAVKAPPLPHEAAEKAITAAVAAMDSALQTKDAPKFFEAARRAVQERLGDRWKLPAAHVTLTEIRSRLDGQGGEVRALFETADEIAYSGRRFSTPDLQQWRELVKTQLQLLSKA